MDGLQEEYVVIFGAYWNDNGSPYHLQEDRWTPIACDNHGAAVELGYEKLATQFHDPVNGAVTVYFKVEQRFSL